MTDREIFEKVRDHLLHQGKQSVVHDGECRYRGPKRTKCAVGCLIPDTNYDPKMEGHGVNSLLKCFPDCFGFEPTSSQVSLLRVLQFCHDHKDPATWASYLDQVWHRHIGG
jgi:hypothetical protein